jgi:Mycotoxin biosynthesis protein UstYa
VRTKQAVPRMYTLHYEHCVDYLRQYIQCKFDTTVLPLAWVREHQQPTPNGNTWHKCVDWGVMQRWLADRMVEMPDSFEWRQPEGTVGLEEDP